jgi:hypothetical protein
MRLALLFTWLCILTATLAGCQNQTPVLQAATIQATDLVDQAAAEATAIIQSARATALLEQARAQAAALLQPAQTGAPLPAVSATLEPPAAASQAVAAVSPQAAPPAAPGYSIPTDIVLPVEPIARQGEVQLLSVTFAADGGFIMVNFIVPPSLASELYQGRLSVTDEATGEVYDAIPVMPVIGPLIGRPIQEGQRGYVMLINRAPQLKPGALATVVIVDARFEHIPVQ